MNIMSPRGLDSIFWDTVADLLHTIPTVVDRGDAVQAFMVPMMPGNASFLSIESYLINKTKNEGHAILDKLRTGIEKRGLSVDSSEESFDHLSAYLAIPKGLDQAGMGMMTASRLISQDLLKSSKGPSQVTKALSKLNFRPGNVLSLEGMVGGPGVRQKSTESRAIHPSWGSAAMSLTLGHALPSDPDWDAYDFAQHELAMTQLPALEALEKGNMGGYLGIPFPYESQSSQVFWGSNYDRLMAIKDHWDPSDLFITRLGVGSERWDEEGMCRVERGWISRIPYQSFVDRAQSLLEQVQTVVS